VRAAPQDIAGLDVLVGLDEIAIIHHTDCGALRYTSEGMREQVKIRSGHNCDEVIDGMDFGAIDKYGSLPSSSLF
jgi:carbonic anhydrase